MSGFVFPSELLHLGRESFLGAGALLWREGDAGGDVALVLDGALEVFRETPDGEIVLDGAEAGHAVGELALDGGTRTASVRARTATRVLSVGAAEFRRLLRERPDILESLYWTQVNRLRRIMRQAGPPRRRLVEPHSRAYSFPFFTARLEGELRRAHESGDTVAVVLCEIDGFPDYERAVPVEQAHQALAIVARALRDRVGRADVVARYGETQFAALLYGMGIAAARDCAEAFRAAVEAHGFPSPHPRTRRLTLSVAVALFPRDGADGEALLRALDLAIYKTKEAGGNRVREADPA